MERKSVKTRVFIKLIVFLLLFITICEGGLYFFFKIKSRELMVKECRTFSSLSSRFIMESFKENYRKSFIRFLEDLAKIVKLNSDLEKVELIDVSGMVIFDSKEILSSFIKSGTRAKRVITDSKVLRYTREIKPRFIFEGDKLVIYYPYLEEFGTHFYTLRYTFSRRGINALMYDTLITFLVFLLVFSLILFYFKYTLLTKFFNGLSVLSNSLRDFSKGKFPVIRDKNVIFSEAYKNFNVLVENYKFILDEKEKSYFTLRDMVSKCEREKKNLENELSKKTEMLKDVIEDARNARREKIDFLAKISHELRTPLNSILGFSGIILQGVRGELKEDLKEDIFSIYKNAQFLLKIIDDVLSLSKIETDKFELEIKKIDIKKLLEDVLREFKPIVDKKGIDMNIFVEEDVPYVLGDEYKIKQVLNNLVDNSIKFTESGYIKVKAVVYSKNPEQVLISVEDTGIGIKDEDIDKIFNEFYQVDGRRGTGIGLSISKKFVETMGGEIWVESKIGRGSTFYFTLPIAK